MNTSGCLTPGRKMLKLALALTRAGLFLLASRPQYAYAPLLGRVPHK
jgi:hypothetical protein